MKMKKMMNIFRKKNSIKITNKSNHVRVLEKLKLNDVQVEALKKIPFIVKNTPINVKYIGLKEISINDLVGSVRHDANAEYSNWFDAIAMTKKLYLLDKIKDWKNIIDEPMYPPYPSVVLIDDKYYHFEEGLHRLFFTKILDLSPSIKVDVFVLDDAK